MKAADADGNGEIEYSENLLTKQRLRTAFDMFDRDGGGTISADEIREVLGVGKKIDEKIWDDIIAEADIDGSGNIDFDEFSKMMKSLLKNNMKGG